MTASALIIPALNEEKSIGSVIRGVDRRLIDMIIVGDNGSSDRTAQIAAELGALVVSVPQRGYGAACAGALSRIAPETRIVVFADADGSDDFSELPDLLAPVLRNEADLVIGSRSKAEPGALSIQQKAGNWIATRLLRILYGYRYSDLGPFRVIRRDLLDAIGMRDRRYGWTVEMQIRALQLGARVKEVPVRYLRRAGRSKISGTVSGVLLAGFWILWTIARCAFSPFAGVKSNHGWAADPFPTRETGADGQPHVPEIA